ncbi:hypothetical protein FRB95_001894 [Tulasnella sp. JGI-2019a]|nr:hypothetical protein FRB95_001894 [Tulasnella sp. JGI-2019a]
MYWETDAHPIVPDGVTIEEMNHFLTLLHAPFFQTDFDHINIRQWAVTLDLANLWSFKATKAYAISVFDTRFVDEDCFDRLERAFAYGVSNWVRPAYDDMCRRPEPLTANEGRQLGWDRYAVICCIREQFAHGTLNAPKGSYGCLFDFSEDSPILQPSSVRSAFTLSPTDSTAGSNFPDETESVPQDEPNNPGGSPETERKQQVPVNSDQCKDSTPEVIHGGNFITVPPPTPNDHEYKETPEAHGSNGDEARQASPQQHDHDRAVVANNLYLLGDEYQFQQNIFKALKAFEDALQLYRELDNRPRIARCLRMIGESGYCPKERRTAYIDASKIYRELGYRRKVAQCVHMVREFEREEGRYSEARTAYHEVLELYPELDDPPEVAKCLHLIGEVERRQGQYEAGVSAYTEAYELFLGLDDKLGVAKNLSMIGTCKRLVPGLTNEALTAYREASQYYKKLYYTRDEARWIELVGECHREEGRYEEAQDAFREASGLYGNQHPLGAEHCLSMISECQRAPGHASM